MASTIFHAHGHGTKQHGVAPADEVEKLSRCYGRCIYKMNIPADQLTDRFKGLAFPDPTVRLRISAKEWFGANYKELATVTPDRDGRFSFDVDTSSIWDLDFLKSGADADTSALRIEVLKLQTPFSDSDGTPEYKVVQTFNKTIIDGHASNDLGNLEMTYAPLHRNFTRVEKPSADQRPSVSYFEDLISAISGNGGVAAFVKVVEKVAPGMLSTDAVHKLFNLVNDLKTRTPTIDDFGWDILAEGLCNEVLAVKPERVSDSEVVWVADFSDCSYDKDADNSLPVRCEVHAKRMADGSRPVIEKIVLHFKDEAEASVVTKDSPLDGRGKAWAALLAMTAFGTAGETSDHLGDGHIRLDKVARAFFLCVPPSHPLYPHVAPLLSGFFFINFLGAQKVVFSPDEDENGPIDTTIGDSSVLGAGDLSEAGVIKYMYNKGVLPNQDWDNIPTREVLYKEHRYAMARNVVREAYQPAFEKLVQGFVDQKVVNDPNFWVPLYRWSEMTCLYDPHFKGFIDGCTQPQGADLQNLPKALTWMMDAICEHYLKHTTQDILLWRATLAPRHKALNDDGSFAPDGRTPPDKRAQVTSIAATLLAVTIPSIQDAKGISEVIRGAHRQALDAAPDFVKKMIEKMYYTVPI